MEEKRVIHTRTSNTHRRGPSVTLLVGRQLEFKNFDQPICRTLYSKQELYVPAASVIVFYSQLLDRNKFSLLSLSLSLSLLLFDTSFFSPTGIRKDLEISRRPAGHRRL